MSYGGQCRYCDEAVDADYAAYRVSGIEMTRWQGGANVIHGRKREPNWIAHQQCAKEALRKESIGIDEGQESLL